MKPSDELATLLNILAISLYQEGDGRMDPKSSKVIAEGNILDMAASILRHRPDLLPESYVKRTRRRKA